MLQSAPSFDGAATEAAAGPPCSSSVPRQTNGFLIRLVGKWLRLSDAWLHRIEWFVGLTLLLPCYCCRLVQGRKARPEQGFREFCFQLFGGWPGVAPALTPVLTDACNAHEEGHLVFVALSDTHNAHRSIQVPDGDVLIHCGDFTNHGSLDEVRSFVEWLASWPHPTKVVVPGNHDMIMDRPYYEAFWNDWSHTYHSTDEALALFRAAGVHVLMESGLDLQGLRIFGSPYVPKSTPWRTAFNVEADAIAARWALIPSEVDVLLTHSPPAGILDRDPFGAPCGCPSLRAELQQRLRPLVHVFGHVHSDWGARQLGSTCFVNASSVTDFYSVGGRVPIRFKVPLKAADSRDARTVSV